jgi:hypothetical protein
LLTTLNTDVLIILPPAAACRREIEREETLPIVNSP